MSFKNCSVHGSASISTIQKRSIIDNSRAHDQEDRLTKTCGHALQRSQTIAVLIPSPALLVDLSLDLVHENCEDEIQVAATSNVVHLIIVVKDGPRVSHATRPKCPISCKKKWIFLHISNYNGG